MDYLVDSFGIFKLALKRGTNKFLFLGAKTFFYVEFTVLLLLDGHVAVM